MYIQVEIMFIGFNTIVEASLFSATENMNKVMDLIIAE